jgi:hypothetical protein
MGWVVSLPPSQGEGELIGSSKSLVPGRNELPDADQRPQAIGHSSHTPRRAPRSLRPHTQQHPHSPTMTTLHRFAASTLRASARPALSQRAPALIRRETVAHNPGMAAGGQKGRPSSDPHHAPTSTHGDAEMITQEAPAHRQAHQPDYDVATDYRVS